MRTLRLLFCAMSIALVLAPTHLPAQIRDILGRVVTYEALRHVLLSAPWHPFPTSAERGPWSSLPPALAAEYVRKGEEALRFPWPTLTASLYLNYARTGDRGAYDRPSSERRDKLIDLVLAECIEGKGRFLDKIMDGVWLICEETSWVPPPHVGDQRAGVGLPDKTEPQVDLFSGETANVLAWTYYLLQKQLDTISPLLSQRIVHEIHERILVPTLSRDDFWWMWDPARKIEGHHINNWTPWICSNWLVAVLAIENDQERRSKAIFKITTILDRFLNSYPEDGGCDEGPSYWSRAGGALFECLELLNSATGNRYQVYETPLVSGMGQYIYKVFIDGSYYANFGDAPAKSNLPADLVIRYGTRIHDPLMIRLGAYAARQQEILRRGVNGNLTRQLSFLFNLALIDTSLGSAPYLRDAWLPNSEIMAARTTEGSPKGFTLVAQGGHNEQSHNHNDVGSFVLYVDGKPLFIDVGVEAYTAKTFSAQRYDIWTMQSAYHNLPTINGHMQAAGRTSAARNVRYRASNDSVTFALDIAGAYPRAAKISTWDRSFHFNRVKGTVDLVESYAVDTATCDYALSLMTPCQVQSSAPGKLAIRVPLDESTHTAAEIQLQYPAEKLTFSVEDVPVKDGRLRRIWGDVLHRILLTGSRLKPVDTLRVSISRLR